MVIVRAENLTKVYGTGENTVTALNGLSLSVQQGEFIAIMGSSGSGKSTLLHILGGVDKPTSGNVYIEEELVSALNEKELALFRRRKIGLVYQFFNLIPNLSIEKNILLPILLDKKEADKNYFKEIVTTLGIEDKLKSFPSELSGGQQQRAAIARSLIYRPAILLADEPTGNLDKKNSDEIIALLKISNKNYNQTIIMITHDERIALEADRIVKIEDGEIV
ncbi:ABC transporter ATP-binding protein [Treponema phagedenis]|uniref:Lipoprotein-releasing system ATP-binding protein LolD n=1 Tax=Treponema phagedenis TaxID=162 RepID=A0A0B7GRY2_TREPH|nr:ABC transporter ATP-binding protein [Treponema phagedenis]QEJ94580.1 ABC transporter ATP-binding protein [Treponema phagedenis]QEK01541.1 ABC transporter ATP-binding protein [Treponema phagedenis]QEK06628.1 ABC transporter ATP-binding protein [Treponema phagedenis]QSH94200.1 ABC transporter ATP-binding protein [Treponema phagedenis]QSI00783.1 ABC transporter ATP-binding protein [Treponema phagedenis]